MLEFLSLGSHSSKPCSAKKQKVQVELLQARVALAWGRPFGGYTVYFNFFPPPPKQTV